MVKGLSTVSLSVLLILLLCIRRVNTRSDCVKVKGTLKCPSNPKLAAGVQIDLKDADSLPLEVDDDMGRTWSLNDGTFTVSGCGDDLGPYNSPDPYILIKHQCPDHQNPNEIITKDKQIQFSLTKTFLPEILRIGTVYLDGSDA
uniref:Transthyretin/hydroxyisourate hydrolase domain-containing protein n=1 Tax=Syphacia muris TaxID=451379 RepID=A0A0N5ANG0_9BILA